MKHIIDNFDQISKLINCGEGEFYMLQIIHRSKDGLTRFDKDEKGHFSNKIIKTYFISSNEYLEKKKEEIIELCRLFNARAYINLNKKSWKQVGLKSLENLAHMIANETYSGIKSLFESACGQVGACDKNKTWVVDVDTKDQTELGYVIETINTCEPFGVVKIIDIIPTLHGYHIISKPFNKKRFSEVHGDVEVHDNNPTILYCEKEMED